MLQNFLIANIAKQVPTNTLVMSNGHAAITASPAEISAYKKTLESSELKTPTHYFYTANGKLVKGYENPFGEHGTKGVGTIDITPVKSGK